MTRRDNILILVSLIAFAVILLATLHYKPEKPVKPMQRGDGWRIHLQTTKKP